MCGESRMRRSGWGPPEKDPLWRVPRWRPTSALWHNLGEYVEKAVAAHRGCLTGAPDEPAGGGQAPPGRLPDAGPAAAPPAEPDGLRDVCGRERALVSRTLERHAAVHELLQAGRSRREAAEILGLDRKTVNRFASQADPAMLLVKATGRESRLDPFKPWINRRWNEGITSAAALHTEMAATQGWTGSPQAVERYVRQFRTADGRTRAGRNPRQAPAVPPARRPARSPAGCSPARTASTLMTRPGSPPSRPAAPTSTPWPGMSAASPR